jgi:hypothetical protein
MGSNCQPVYVVDPEIASIISIYSPPGAALWDDEQKYYVLKDEAHDTMTEKDAIGPLLSELRPHRLQSRTYLHPLLYLHACITKVVTPSPEQMPQPSLSLLLQNLLLTVYLKVALLPYDH